MSKSYDDELLFEADVIKVLQAHGREKTVIKNPTEKDLIDNWKNILFQNNNTRERLNWHPLTDWEFWQILEQINNKSSLDLNTNFINARTISIKRDNEDDKIHYGKEISLKIYDRNEIAAWSSVYQIVEQPKYNKKNVILPNRRWDLMLLINWMPVIHIELKRSWVSVYQASTQIEKYAFEWVYTWIFSLVQVFVAMTPEETLYFANPWRWQEFDRKFYFHWADFNNNPMNDWRKVTESLLSIPMAHTLVWFYTVADNWDNKLKVLRSYQYYAANAIANKVSKIDNWNTKNKWWYIWHTTWSGKTLTSFKTAQLIASSKDADKVVFLIDRIELWTQTLKEYRWFADSPQDVQETENTWILIWKLRSDDPDKTLIVTSIQKMSNIVDWDPEIAHDLKIIKKKRIVFVIDECHRDTFWKMLATIKQTFPTAIFFWFTWTPIFEWHEKNWEFTASIFWEELHRYSIADWIRDKNVLWFDPYQCHSYDADELKRMVALKVIWVTSEDELDEKWKEKYEKLLKLDMIWIEDKITNDMWVYWTKFKKKVVENILKWWKTLSVNNKYSAILATNSINDAIDYYNIFKDPNFKSTLKVAALFDPNIDNSFWFKKKEKWLVEIYEDYNKRYNTKFNLSKSWDYKDDLSRRFARKKPYQNIKENEKIDLLIVVDQMLTWFDSKWINTLYLDKVLQKESIIQAFSRTNRIAWNDKPFWVIKYYRKPYTMEQNIKQAIKLYSWDREFWIFVDKIEENVRELKRINKEIEDLFKSNWIENIDTLPESEPAKNKFESLFRKFNQVFECAKIQDFKWKQYEEWNFNEQRYQILVQRYKDIKHKPIKETPPDETDEQEVIFDLDPTILSIDTKKIDDDYMNSNFVKYCKALSNWEKTDSILEDLHKSFASLSQEDQEYANIIIHDIESWKLIINESDEKTLKDYIVEYKKNKEDKNISALIKVFWINKELLSDLITQNLWSNTIEPFAKFVELTKWINKENAKRYFEKRDWKEYSKATINRMSSQLIERFILSWGFEIDSNLN